jgi:hypothetical protein
MLPEDFNITAARRFTLDCGAGAFQRITERRQPAELHRPVETGRA